MKCVVSACPNWINRKIFKQPAKKFFRLPADPERVQVWLAALRETDKPDLTEHHLICEDHFLPEHISSSGISTDAIPIMPQCLDERLSLTSPWGAESEEDEDQWTSDGEEAVEGGDETPPSEDPLEQDSGAKKTSGVKTTSVGPHETTREDKQGWSVGKVTQRFLEMFLTVPDGLLDLRQVTTRLRTHKQRVNDITNILQSVNLIERHSTNVIKWIGGSPVSSFLSKNQQKLRRELQNLKLVEETLDSLIKSCSRQLFIMTDDQESSPMAYVTLKDLSRLRVFQEQTMLVVKAPDETTLSVPAPSEDSIRVHLKGAGPIVVLTCDITGGNNVRFVTLEESRVTTTSLLKESLNSQSPVQKVTS
ncbi:transcription factor E2F6-like [Paralichthys olivaceus]|uniref:transcription factor E2F6-like n=1 Tax=Paralichthys olivaceus TaxID=8255 RepID=UPI003751B276